MNKKKREALLTTGEPKYLRFAPYLVFIVAFLVYFPTIRSGFVYFDDDILILENYEKLSNPANLFSAFTHDAYFRNAYPYYRPLLSVSLIIDAQLGGKAPGIYHFSNLLIHGLTCLSFFWLLSLLGFSRTKSLIGALVFSVHPLLANAVLFIAARTDEMVTLFAILSFAFIILYHRDRKWYHLALHVLCFAAALFSKESAVFLPLMYLLYFLLKKEKIFNLRSLYFLAGWIVVYALWFYLRSLSIDNTSLDQVGLAAVVKSIAFPAEIISKFLLPVSLSIMPVYTAYNTVSGIVLLLLILFLVFFRKYQANPLVIFGFVWFFAFSLLNMSSRISNADYNFTYLEQRAYFLSVGLIILLLPLLPEAFLNLRKWPVVLAISVIFVTLSVMTLRQETKYKSPENFWTSAINDFPDRSRYHFNYGRYFFKMNDIPSFETHLRDALKLQKDPEYLYNMGMVNAVSKKQYDTAYYYFTEAFKSGLTVSGATGNFVTFCIESSVDLYNKKEYAKAIERCSLAIEKDPANAGAYLNLGTFYMDAGNKRRAAVSWRKALSLDPELKDGYKCLYYYYLLNTTMKDSALYYKEEYQKRGGIIEADRK
jgi:protein O-mannosyl-transferase